MSWDRPTTMFYVIESGDPTGSHALSTVEGSPRLDLDALWAEFNGPINEYLGDEPDVTERSRSRAWREHRLAYLKSCYRTMSGRDTEADTFVLTHLFIAWHCKYHGCIEPDTTFFGTEL